MGDVCWRSSSTVVDVPVIKQRQVGVATMLHMAVMAALKYGGLDWPWRGFFGGIGAIFRALPVVPELSASFRALEHSHL